MSLNLKDRDHKISELTDRVNELEQNQLNNYLEISGVPVKPNEDVQKIVQQVAQVCEVEDSNIVDVYREASRKANIPPPIIVQFSSSAARNTWLRRTEGRKLTVDDVLENGADSSVYLNEQLTPYNKKLLWQTKQSGKEKNYNFIWTRNGKIFARLREEVGVVRIRNQSDILNKIV
jgi:hypothetical protein